MPKKVLKKRFPIYGLEANPHPSLQNAESGFPFLPFDTEMKEFFILLILVTTAMFS